VPICSRLGFGRFRSGQHRLGCRRGTEPGNGLHGTGRYWRISPMHLCLTSPAGRGQRSGRKCWWVCPSTRRRPPGHDTGLGGRSAGRWRYCSLRWRLQRRQRGGSPDFRPGCSRQVRCRRAVRDPGPSRFPGCFPVFFPGPLTSLRGAGLLRKASAGTPTGGSGDKRGRKGPSRRNMAVAPGPTGRRPDRIDPGGFRYPG